MSRYVCYSVCFSILDDRCGSLWDRCGSLWVVVDRCGSLWVVPDFSNYVETLATQATVVDFTMLYVVTRRLLLSSPASSLVINLLTIFLSLELLMNFDY